MAEDPRTPDRGRRDSGAARWISGGPLPPLNCSRTALSCYSIRARSHERLSAPMSNRRPHSGHTPVSGIPLRSYTQLTHARPDAARTARLIRSVRRRAYQNAPTVVVTIASGIPGRAQRGEIDGAARLSTNGAATALRAVHTNTAATLASYRRNAGGSGEAGSVGLGVTGNGTAGAQHARRSATVDGVIRPKAAGLETFNSPRHPGQIAPESLVWRAAIEMPSSAHVPFAQRKALRCAHRRALLSIKSG